MLTLQLRYRMFGYTVRQVESAGAWGANGVSTTTTRTMSDGQNIKLATRTHRHVTEAMQAVSIHSMRSLDVPARSGETMQAQCGEQHFVKLRWR
jgi:hypothetical protein